MSKVIIVTHSGNFHADDVFAVATLELLCAKEGLQTEILRSRDSKIWEQANYLVDVGGENTPENNKFDHHQIGGAGARANGIPYAAFGLVWIKIGTKLCESEAVANIIDEIIVQSVDAHDGGTEIISSLFKNVYPYTIGNAISAFVPDREKNVGQYDQAFSNAVIFAKGVLAREINKIKDIEGNKDFIKKAYENAEDKRLVIFDVSYNEFSVSTVLQKFPEVIYTLYPKDSSWHLKAVRKEPHGFESRKPLPESWAGKKDDELVKVTGVSDAVFCHNGRFLAVTLSKEGALKLAELALTA